MELIRTGKPKLNIDRRKNIEEIIGTPELKAGIFNILLEHLKNFRERGNKFDREEDLDKKYESYFHYVDTKTQFLETIERKAGNKLFKSEIEEKYNKFCFDIKQNPSSKEQLFFSLYNKFNIDSVEIKNLKAINPKTKRRARYIPNLAFEKKKKKEGSKDEKILVQKELSETKDTDENLNSILSERLLNIIKRESEKGGQATLDLLKKEVKIELGWKIGKLKEELANLIKKGKIFYSKENTYIIS